MLASKIDECLTADGLDASAAANLTPVQQAKHLQDAWTDICIPVGHAAYDALLPEEKQARVLVIRLGCCMHKELNAAKGAAAALEASWTDSGHASPIMLYNRDNAAAAAAAPEGSKERERVEAVSSCGGIKVAQLAGALFNHKDDKKGHQDEYKFYFSVCSICSSS